jgi:hypothetical protein
LPLLAQYLVQFLVVAGVYSGVRGYRRHGRPM